MGLHFQDMSVYLWSICLGFLATESCWVLLVAPDIAHL